MAKADNIEELEEIEEITDEVEDDEDEATEELGTRPVDLAQALGINPKSLRAWLRKTYPRPAQDKNKSWYLDEAQVDAAWAHFVDEDDESDDEVEDEVAVSDEE